jgi:hypothetical protein
MIQVRPVILAWLTIVVVWTLYSSSLLGGRFPELITPIITQLGDDIIFDLPSSKKPSVTILRDVIVSRKPDQDQTSEPEIFWHVHMDRRIFKGDPLIRWPIRYGDQIPNAVEAVAARRWRPGRYVLDVSMIFENEDGSRSYDAEKLVLEEFSIDNNLRLQR